MNQKVLIAGAGVAGLTMAYWLGRYGCQVTVVELSKGLRKGGAAVDIRGGALAVADRMGLLEQLQMKRVSTAVDFVDEQDRCIATLKDFGSDTAGQDIELHRDHLIEILYGAAGGAEYLFGNRIKGISQGDERVHVVFESGRERDFDLVIGADGVHSALRKLVFGQELQFNHFYGAYFSILKAAGPLRERNYGRIYNVPNKMAAVSDQGNAMLLFRSPKLSYDYRDGAAANNLLQAAFMNCGWKVPVILEAMANSADLYFDELCQIKMPGWSKGRVVLIGDAAHGAGFPTGMGTSLAMQGAAILADALQRLNGDYPKAFLAYETALRPLVEQVQATIVAGIDFLVPETEAAIRARNDNFS